MYCDFCVQLESAQKVGMQQLSEIWIICMLYFYLPAAHKIGHHIFLQPGVKSYYNSINSCTYVYSGLTSSFQEGRPLEVTEPYRLNRKRAVTSPENSITAKIEPFKVYSLFRELSLQHMQSLRCQSMSARELHV